MENSTLESLRERYFDKISEIYQKRGIKEGQITDKFNILFDTLEEIIEKGHVLGVKIQRPELTNITQENLNDLEVTVSFFLNERENTRSRYLPIIQRIAYEDKSKASNEIKYKLLYNTIMKMHEGRTFEGAFESIPSPERLGNKITSEDLENLEYTACTLVELLDEEVRKQFFPVIKKLGENALR